MIEVKNLSIGYEGKAVATNIDFNVGAGDFLCIIGENGVGKSTLIKSMLHLNKPMSGEINIHEKSIGYLPQQTVVQKDFPASVWEIVMSGNLHRLGFKPFYTSEEKKIAKNNMKRMGVWDLRKECFRNLSGGQRQRVLLARALCASDRILILDEPVSGLDTRAIADFYNLTTQLNKAGTTIIMVSHDLDAVLNISSHILYIGKEDNFFGTTEEFLQSPIAERLEIINWGEDDINAGND